MRYMRTDQMSLDDTAIVLLQAPDTLTADELADIREWMELKLRQWARRVFVDHQVATTSESGEPKAKAGRAAEDAVSNCAEPGNRPSGVAT